MLTDTMECTTSLSGMCKDQLLIDVLRGVD